MADLSETLEQIALEALSLAELAERFPKVLDGFLSLPHSLIEITVRDDGRTASGAYKLSLGAKASDRADVLLAALRAGHANLSILEHLLSPVLSDNDTVEAPAGGVTSPSSRPRRANSVMAVVR
ncbi:hypothetical protein ACFPIF_10345 [Brevundimonas faecalis]|uniref:hypothetical protein n=1 Tax=Brevundimonas faecalis TaxID=947378 RepID=UPI0036163A59